MSVEILNLLKNEARFSTENKPAGHWIRRREALRLKREQYRNEHHRNREKRQVDAVTSGTEQTELEIRSSTRRALSPNSSRVSAGESEWDGATGGPPAEVVLRIHPAASPTANINGSQLDIDGSGVVVRAEEALIVAFVLLLWVAAIALFFNRWGKIRCVYKLMLEPYQPKFQQQHRQSCVLAENSVVVPPHHRASLSRGCVSYDCGASFPSYQPYGYLAHRPRQYFTPRPCTLQSLGVAAYGVLLTLVGRGTRLPAKFSGYYSTSSRSHCRRSHTHRQFRYAWLSERLSVFLHILPTGGGARWNAPSSHRKIFKRC
ncbi:hypothetical protein K1T71_007979 [Dendrolimus kikuchii]|uniref:Uncharacterized protein n=1 Tax=Dendrolimus kikuchii TaxID=765133 RepID=A0ACC1CZ06_9NEOP|nr:hypothetical protein K1T71_007979 [Dendrolimus kikuchii]